MKRNEFIKSSAGLLAGGLALSSFTNPGAEPDLRDKILPKALVPGDLIAITAPAGSIWNKAHIDKIEKLLHEQGFKTTLGKTVYEQDGYLAGNDELRATELMDFFKDKSVKGIVTMRGGWGCARILDRLDYDIIRVNPKIIIGFSDITSLINAIYVRAKIITYHGPCGYSSWGDFTMTYVKKALAIGTPYVMKNPFDYAAELKTWVPGKATGELIGGNLTVVVSMVGTVYEPDWQQKILFLEEIGEEPYRVDRMLWQLKQRGVFEQIKGVVLGSFKDCEPEEPEKSFDLEQVFAQHFVKASFPVYQGAAFGHIGPKFTLPIGVLAEMDADEFTIKTLERSVGM